MQHQSKERRGYHIASPVCYDACHTSGQTKQKTRRNDSYDSVISLHVVSVVYANMQSPTGASFWNLTIYIYMHAAVISNVQHAGLAQVGWSVHRVSRTGIQHRYPVGLGFRFCHNAVERVVFSIF